MRKSKSRSAYPVPLVLSICMMTFMSSAIFAAKQDAGRSFHVSQQPLIGIAEKQFRTISEAASTVQPGDTVVIHGGVYRETVTVEKSGTPSQLIRFAAAPGERVVVTGADRIIDWKRESDSESIYSTAWDHEFIGWAKDHAYAARAPIGRVEQVFVDNYPMHQVMSEEHLSAGSFFIDEKARRLHIRIADNAYGMTPSIIENLSIEASTRAMLWHVKGDYICTSGIRFRYAANHALMGAATFAGSNGLLENCIFERTNGDGARFEGENIIVRNCIFRDNGFVGFEAVNAHNLRMTDCLIRNNNVKNFDRGWGGAANKIVLSRNVILERSSFIENRGVGIWFDIGNESCIVRNCLIADNENGGIFYEISYGLQAHDNVLIGNGFSGGYGSWGTTGGICLSSSPNSIIERNLIIGNAEGISFREQLRTTPKIGDDKREVPIWNHRETIRRNVIAYNGVQTWGWFAVGDGRHWPRSMRKTVRSDGKPSGDIAADYVAKDPSTQPVGLALEDLKLNMGGNLYYVSPGQQLFNWGPSWEDCKRYTSLDSLRKELGLELGSRTANPSFTDLASRDLRVPARSPAINMGCYPKGNVPGIKLGILK